MRKTRHSRHDQTSCFELAVLSRNASRLDFINTCLDKVVEGICPETLDLKFKVLRSAIELDRWECWERLQRMREGVSGVKDQDDWQLNHFVHQSANRMPGHLSPLDLPKIPTKLVIPSHWIPRGMSIQGRADISPNKLGVTFKSGHSSEQELMILCIRADCPFLPRDMGQAYFEVTISSAETLVHDDEPEIITVGFCGEFSDQTEAHAGCRTWSVGYHGNNVSIYEEDDQYLYTTPYKFGLGNKVGCGIDYEKQVYFFTRDGLVSSDNKSEIIFRKLYPLISHSGGACNVSVNFGQSDFVWRGAEKLREPSLRYQMNTSQKELYERPLSRV